MALRAELEIQSWHGHGEGGALATIKILGWQHDGYPWNSSPEDLRRAADIVERINKVLETVENGT